MVLFIFFSCNDIKVPTCEESEDTACFRGAFRTLLGAPIEFVEVCAPDFPDLDCVLTDEEGGWKIPGFPLDTNVFITAEHPDYVSVLFPQHTSMSWYDWYKVSFPPTVMETNANQLDLTLSEDRGHLLFLTWEGLNIDGVDTDNIPNVTGELADNTGRLFYANGIGLASSDAEMTSNSGSGGVLNLEEGEYQMRLTAPAGHCAQDHMFHYLASDEWIPVPIREGFTTAIDVICPIE
jgi:hypothetical protein